jgi:hypothetical protein
MSNLLDSVDRDIPGWLPPASSLGGEVNVACTEMAGSEREVPFPRRAHGLGTLHGQPLREATIGITAVTAVRACRCLGLSVDVSDWPLRSPSALEFPGTPLGGNGQYAKVLRERRGIHIPRNAATGWFCAPILVLQIAKGLGLDEF